jgi:hypothetical protein
MGVCNIGISDNHGSATPKIAGKCRACVADRASFDEHVISPFAQLNRD